MDPLLLYTVFFISFLGFTGAFQESTLIGSLNFQHKLLQLPQSNNIDASLAVSVSHNKTITEISSSVLKAETWVKTHVLSRYPSTKITTIVVFFPDSCQKTYQQPIFDSLKNLYYSLTRWGLEKDIKVSFGFTYQCLKNPKTLKHLEEDSFKPVLIFLKTINSTFTINPPLNFLSSPENHLGLLHSLEKLGSLSFNKVNFLNPETNEATMLMTRRKLRSFVDLNSKITISIPDLPSPSPENPPQNPNPPISEPPLSQFSPISQPPFSQFAPDLTLPPCSPSPAPAPVKRNVESLWCVAKPSVAAETLQQALDFACGEGGANCDEIKPHGICFYPNTAVAHASYAFNSYWQKTKRNGGSCSFGGTAMVITSDPSYQHCRFTLS